MKQLALKLAAFSLGVILLQVLLSLSWTVERGGCGLRLRLSVPSPYTPTPQILNIQRHSVVHPSLGFLWRPKLGADSAVIMAWDDGEAGELYSDVFGFANTREAIDEFDTGRRPDIIGIGASYMGGAQTLFHDYFGLRGLFYYSFAHGRYCMPQFNIILRDYALPLGPRLIVYGLNELSYLFVDDFEAWASSGMDWFTYHSGTWCGPVIKRGLAGRLLNSNDGIHGLWNAVTKKLWWGAGMPAAQHERTFRKTYTYIRHAHALARAAGAGFVVLYIPSRETATAGPRAASALFDKMSPLLDRAGISYIDMRPTFGSVEDPRGLYFVYDDHWNRHGIYLAAQELLQRFESLSAESGAQ